MKNILNCWRALLCAFALVFTFAQAGRAQSQPTTHDLTISNLAQSVDQLGRIVVTGDVKGDLPGTFTLALEVGADGRISGGEWAINVSYIQFGPPSSDGDGDASESLVQLGVIKGSVSAGSADLTGDGLLAAVSFSATGNCAMAGGAVHATGAGSCSVTATQGGDSNYLAAQSVTQQFSIGQRALVVSAGSASRQYGSQNPAFTGTVSGIVNNDAVTATYSTSAVSSSSVGTYAIVPALSGAALTNYAVTTNNGTLTVTQAPLSVTAGAASRTYGSANPAFTGTISGIVNSDAITATYSTSAVSSSPVGTYAIVPAVSGAALTNYAVTTNNGTLTVTQASLSVTADSFSRVYGSANPVFTGTVSGIVNSDAITATYSTTATAGTAVGSYAIVPALSGAALSNYAVTTSNGTLTVTAAPLVVTPADASRTYGSANPVFTGSISGLQNNDAISATYATAATTASDPGSYAITAQLIDPQGKLGNYAVTLNTGTLSIAKANQVIGWAAPAAMTYATPLSAAQLNAAVSVPGPSAAGAVSYSPAAGTVLDAGTQTLTVSVAGTVDYNPATATVQLAVNKAQPVFHGLNNATVVYHTGSVTFTGALTAPTAIPAGQQVAVTLNNVTQNAVVASNGSFTTTFNMAALAMSANGYSVSYSYAGSNDFTAASGTSTLTVAYAVCDLYDPGQAKQSGSTYPIKVAVCDANNQNVSTPGMVLTAVGWGGSTPAYSPVPDAGNSNGNGTFRNTGASFMWNLKTTNMGAGNYNMFFTISGDPTLHFAPFAVR